jgi:hypothetical protein
VPGSIVAAEADAGAISDDELAADGEADSGEAASDVELEEDEFEADELEEVEFESGEGAAVALAPIADEGATLCGGAWPWAKLLRLRPAKTTPKTAVWKRLIVLFTLVPGDARKCPPAEFPTSHSSQHWMPTWLVR